MKNKLIRNKQEAVECIKKNMPSSGYEMLKESMNMAIEALEKRIAKKPKENFLGTYCSECKHYLDGTEYCCPFCGQAIDWEEVV